MKEAIQKAIEGGWNPKVYPYKDCLPFFTHTPYQGSLIEEIIQVIQREWTPRDITSDPSFWQALGKSCGWKKETQDKYCNNCKTLHFNNTPYNKVRCQTFENGKLELYYWHRFIDHLAEGKDAESFFKELLKT